MSRSGNFAAGAVVHQSPSLMTTADKQNSQDPRTFKANGLNQPIMHSPMNGNSQSDASRQTPSGQLPGQNGMSSDTYKQLNPSMGTNLNI